MSFKEEHPEMWNIAIRKFGYICPECGNRKTFKQYQEIVKEVSCDENTGIIEYCNIKFVSDSNPSITKVECTKCNTQAVICEKGVAIHKSFQS